MPYQRILIPTDGTPKGDHAAEEGIALARALGASVHGVYVIDTGLFATVPLDLAVEATRNALRREGETALARVEALAQDNGVPFTGEVREGEPDQEILAAATDDTDLIVMGTWGRKGLSHLLFGSVAEKVLRDAPCPVLVVRTSEAELTHPHPHGSPTRDSIPPAP